MKQQGRRQPATARARHGRIKAGSERWPRWTYLGLAVALLLLALFVSVQGSGDQVSAPAFAPIALSAPTALVPAPVAEAPLATRPPPTQVPTASVLAPTPRPTEAPRAASTPTPPRPPLPTATAPESRAALASSTPVASQGASKPSIAPTLALPTRPAEKPAALVKPTVATQAPSEKPSGQRVSLTFDAGADRGYAEDILDVLLAEKVPASFGITGGWAKAHPDLVRRMAAEGHHVINHTMTHRSFTGLSDNLGGLTPARRRAELEEADAILAPLVGRSTAPWYRLPYGDDDARVAADVAPAGYSRKAGWTVDSLGWRGVSADEIVARCLRLAAPNAVYVLHVGRSSQDGPALLRIIAGLRKQGFGFATMADL